MSHYAEFGVEARKIMLQKNITLTNLAQQLGVSVTYVWEILKGTRKGVKYKKRICEILVLESEAIK